MVLLKPIAVELDDEPEPSPAPGAAGPSGARGADGGGTAPDMHAGYLLCSRWLTRMDSSYGWRADADRGDLTAFIDRVQ